MRTPEKMQNIGVTIKDLKTFVSYAEFKRIFDNLDHLLNSGQIRSLSILSFHPEEGRSFICATIALGMTEMLGQRVLLVDAGNPTSNWDLDDIFEHQDSPVLEPEGMVYSLAPNLDGLKLSRLATVAHKAQEYRIQDIIAEYKNRYDLILFDSAALRTTNRGNFDPWVIAARTDASLLVTSPKTGDLAHQFQVEPLLKSKVVGVIENMGAV